MGRSFIALYNIAHVMIFQPGRRMSPPAAPLTLGVRPAASTGEKFACAARARPVHRHFDRGQIGRAGSAPNVSVGRCTHPRHLGSSSLVWVGAVQRRRTPVGATPTLQPLQPEATGAAMEVTKWLKPSVSVSRYTVTARVCRP